MRIFIEKIKDPVEKQEVEFVESKGLGHPDSICDAVCDACGSALARYYLKSFGTVLHYNIDKALLVAGTAKPKFGGGRMISPIRLTIAGRVTDKVGNRNLPVRDIIIHTATKYLKQFSHAQFNVIVDVKSAAANLAQVSERKKPVANDTSFGASHYPFSMTEKLVLNACAYLNSPAFMKMFPSAGPDVKVMGIRTKDKIELTVAIAFIGKHICSMKEYVGIKEKISTHLAGRFKADVCINTLDDVSGDEESIYLTASGLSAEMGDDGQVGRGNRYNGIITPGRPMSIEAVSGKNARHPGRSYQIAAFEIAKALVEKHKIKSAEVKLVTDIGAPLDEPKAVSLKMDGKLSHPQAKSLVRKCIASVVERSA